MDKGLGSINTASKKVAHEAGEFLRNKTADTVTKSNDDKIQKQEPVEEIIIPLEKREEVLNKLTKLFRKWNTMNYLNQ